MGPTSKGKEGSGSEEVRGEGDKGAGRGGLEPPPLQILDTPLWGLV